MSGGIPTKYTGTETGANRRAVREGQSDPELKKYLWVVIRTQKDRKLQTLIEVCTDFSSLTAPTHTHRPAEQTFAVHQPMEASFVEENC